MAENKLIIVVGEDRVLSELTCDPASNTYRITSSCGDFTQTVPMTVLPRPGYSPEQLEYDIEVRRHDLAAAAAGGASVKALMASSIVTVKEIPEVAKGPRFGKPVGADPDRQTPTSLT